ncbi:hypothetical protein [Hymenobacter cellulosivorans]|uniref:Lipocalin-like domain-containing protein n=1 Tax=Hymenobacter cellulosivorans TaxID=2932249 RepID=A0ABY4F5W8_9BACT|nr:hypothetical protein [Hymenobacter cellulosivorans]UOQ51874.1 hypothetical protein MUN80_19180 [Hymenobacter cellulosivorans]
MPRLFPLLLLCLTLLLAACKKDSAEPEPPLEGAWLKVEDVKSIYDPTGKLLDTYTSPNLEGFTWEFTSTSHQLFFTYRGQYTPAGPPLTFKRVGNKLMHDQNGEVAQILTLTQHQLVLFYEKQFPDANGNRTDWRLTFSR